MKKAAVATPNLRLKEARELRGWSQKYVADEIGADRYYLSRWEHGIAFPSPYYRQKLCALFDKDARELGLIREEAAKELPEAGPTAVTSINFPLYDPTLPSPLTGFDRLIGRDAILLQLRQRLIASRGAALISIYGLPGVGKTTLAVELAHDEAIRAHFQEGVLWAGLGPSPDIFAILNHWGMLLGISPLQAAKLKSAEDWSKALRAQIGQHRFLLLIDDAWRIEAALAFKVGGPNCSYLVTTRFPNVTYHFTASVDDALALHELDSDDGFALLSRLAPEVVRQEPEGARALIEAVGSLPLALTLMGKYLRAQSHSGQPRRIRAALERLRTADERLHLTEPLPLLERPVGLGESMPLSLQTVIAITDRKLEEAEQLALRALSIFPAKPNNFSEEAAIAVSDAPVEVLDALSDAGLLESSGPGRYTLHQTITDYAQAHREDNTPYRRVAEYFAAYVEQYKKEYDLLEQESNNIFAALDIAYSHNHADCFVRCVNALYPFLFARGLYVTRGRLYIERAVEVARSLNNDTLLATALLNLGKSLYKQGNYAQAEEYLQEGRAKAERIGDLKLLCEFLSTLGNFARYRISFEQAEVYLQRYLELARQLNDPELLGDALQSFGGALSDQGRYVEAVQYNQEALALLQTTGNQSGVIQCLINLSTLALLQGNYAQAETFGQEALALARKVGLLDSISVMLTNLGAAAIDHQEYAKAETYLQEALAIARRIGDARVSAADLGSLGQIAQLQGRYEQAESYLQEALAQARMLGDIWLLGAVLVECGELALKQQRLDDAAAAFQEAQAVALNSHLESVASALYGLARIAAARGDIAGARRQGQESLRIFSDMGHRLKDTVKDWLANSQSA
jgi:tetratricopeptide (TPR) repeat protein/transcriptional regulator with XRE-family HTH domain